MTPPDARQHGGSVGVVGLGRMGHAMAARLLETGWTVVGHDLDRSRVQALKQNGLVAAGDLAQVATTCDVVLLSLYDDHQLRSVVEGEGGLGSNARAGLTVVDTSTVHPETSAACAETLARAGADFVRATVSGNAGLARNGTLTMFVSGPGTYERIKPLLESLSSDHRYLGLNEEARVAKLAVNLMVIGTMSLLAEALALAEAGGLERREALELLNDSVVGSRFLAYKLEPLVERDFSVTASGAGVRKDLELVLRLARTEEISVPVLAAADQAYAASIEAGYGNLDFSALTLLHERASEAS